MNTLKKTLRIPKDRELKIKLPNTFDIDKKVIVLIEEDKSEEYKKNIVLMKKASKDPLYLQDMKEVMDEFKYIDSENIN